MRRIRLGMAAVVATTFAAVAAAQQHTSPPPESDDDGSSRRLGFWNVEVMIDRACKQIKTRYSLNEQQDAYTRKLMAKRVKGFLDKHESEVRRLLMEVMMARTSGKPPTPEQMKGWAQRALPIYEDAKKEILTANDDWREILDSKQQKIHDFDMKLAHANFAQTDERIHRWAEGGFDAERDGFVRRRHTRGTPPNITDFWETYVNRFIESYKLDADQTATARAILKDCRGRARSYEQTHKAEIVEARKRFSDARQQGDQDRVNEIQKELVELNRPISDLFKELRERLDQIPTAQQRRHREEAIERSREKLRQRIEENRRRREAAGTSTAPAVPVE